MATFSGVTSGTVNLATGQTLGGVTLVGVVSSPDLRAGIFGQSNFQSRDSLAAWIRPLLSDQTQTVTLLAAASYPGIHLVGTGLPAPDLRAAIFSEVERPEAYLSAKIRDGYAASGDLSAYYWSSSADQSDLSSYYRAMVADIVDLKSFYRTLTSGSPLTLSGFIEPIPPIPLSGSITGNIPVEISGSIEAVSPSTLDATISGYPALSLTASLLGLEYQDLSAELEGFKYFSLSGFINGLVAAENSFSGAYQGITGSDESSLSGSIDSAIFKGSGTLAGRIFGIYSRDLLAKILCVTGSETDLFADITGSEDPDYLHGLITSTGGFNDLRAFIRPQLPYSLSLSGAIDARPYADLIAAITVDRDGIINSSISGAGPYFNDSLGSKYEGFAATSLSGAYQYFDPTSLSGTINAIGAVDLFAYIKPKYVYIDTAVPITFFKTGSLRAMVNGDPCALNKGLGDLRASIVVGPAGEINSSIYGMVANAQIVLETTSSPVLTKSQTEVADWKFYIAKPLIEADYYAPIILTNRPLSDLAASIEGLPEASPLQASIEPRYFSSAVNSITPIGEWVNTKTGERKVIRILAKSKKQNYWYMGQASDVVGEDWDLGLELLVETFVPNPEFVPTPGNLLYTKTASRTQPIGHLSMYDTFDEAVKHGIVRSLWELQHGLSATISGYDPYIRQDLRAQIYGKSTRKTKYLYAEYQALGNMPELDATVSGHGGFSYLAANYQPKIKQLTDFLLEDELGNEYHSVLVQRWDGDYEAVLTQVYPPGTVAITSPALKVTVSGIMCSHISASISGAI